MVDSRGYEFEGRSPEIHSNAFVARDATLVGEVTVASNASVWPGATLRGDVGPVEIGPAARIEENTSLHVVTVGERGMVADGAVLNEATVGDGAVVGFNATVTEAEIGPRSVVAAGAVVQRGTDVPPESFVHGVPARITPLSETSIDAGGIYDAYTTGEYDSLPARHAELFGNDE
ncbi:MAG: gamma carbonic anhydrase family protein [Haloarculaceae archaeon]